MFLIKILVGVACVYCCYKISLSRADTLKQSYIFFDSAVELCNFLLQELSYKKRPLNAISSKKFISSDFNKTISEFLLENRINLPSYLNEYEREKFTSFFQALGKSDTESQKIAINASKIDFENTTIQKKLEYNKTYSIILKVGFSIGVMLFIMVI